MKTYDAHYLVKAATLYYVDGLNQSEVAKRLGLSRPTIVRMLRQARDQGIVQINVVQVSQGASTLGAEVEAAYAEYGVNEVIVVDDSSLTPKRAVAKGGAVYLGRTLRPKHILGFGLSTTLLHLPDFYRPTKYKPDCIVQLTGYAGGEFGSDSQEIAMTLGKDLSVPVHYLPAPILAGSKSARDHFLKDPVIRRTMGVIKNVNYAVVGIGVAGKDATLRKTGYLTVRELNSIAKMGAVGDLLGYYFDAAGEFVKTPWEDRLIGMRLSALRSVQQVVGIASGAEKQRAVAGALRTGILNTLIVDSPLAQSLLKSSAM